MRRMSRLISPARSAKVLWTRKSKPRCQARRQQAKCTACHGADGNSTNPSWPNLVGQSKDYLVNALKAYKGGVRKNGMMAGIAKGLSDADIENVAAYYAAATCK